MTSFYLLVAKICHSVPALRRPFWKYVYQRLASRYAVPEWVFMNYGYLPADHLKLEPGDESQRSLISLYHHVAVPGELEGKRVLEVGCGRGGGASYVARYLKPSEMKAVDISENAVTFCRERHPFPQLSFERGDAEHLPFQDGEFDAVLNVESSHCYGDVSRFFGEAYRVLNPGGSFLYADFKPTEDVEGVVASVRKAGFQINENEDITQNVLSALAQDSERKEVWIAELAEASLQGTLNIFAATSGTKLFSEFQNGVLTYYRIHARKA